MYQYSRLFGTARIPTATGCVMETDITSNHIIVLCRSQFYWFDVLDANSDVIITEKDLVANFEAIIEDARSTPVRDAAKTAVGVLSTENRRIWAGLRDHLLKDESGREVPPNRESLQIVDSALFVVCLDDTEPVGTAKVAENVLSGSYRLEDGVQTGTCTNRWYDKLQIIVCKNGAAGINFERTSHQISSIANV
jgi:carnitine O-acetyltransferase